jgi:cholesterol transport system auxiliary component
MKDRIRMTSLIANRFTTETATGRRSSLRMLKRLLAVGTVALLSGCAGLPGFSVPDDTFTLSEPPVLESLPSAPRRQVLVTQPIALDILDSNQIVIRTGPSAVQYLAASQWNDVLPRIVQSQLIKAFENTNAIGGVGREGEGLAIDYQLITTIRNFEVVAYGSPLARVEFSVKLLNDRNGVVMAQRVFTATAPVPAGGNEAYVYALDAALDQVIAEIVPWAMQRF